MKQQQQFKGCIMTDVMLDRLRTHRLSPLLEIVLSWMVAVLCLTYYGFCYYFLRNRPNGKAHDPSRIVPLVTQVRKEVRQDECNTLYQEIHQAIGEHVNEPRLELWWKKKEQITSFIRNNDTLRRKVSLWMTALSSTGAAADYDTPHGYENSITTTAILYRFFQNIWLDLLRLPSLPNQSIKVGISVIVPIYKESPDSIQCTVRRAMSNCKHPQSIFHVILVFAAAEQLFGNNAVNSNMKNTIHALQSEYPNLECIHASTQGRGPTMNLGAAHAAVGKDNAVILTFLHADTLLPEHWDEKVLKTFFDDNNNDSKIRHHACAMTFGHDTSTRGLRGMEYPHGIEAIRWLGNVRASLFSLPYGDHVLSLPAAYFHYLGGYPEQPIMEDYDLMDLLRQRAQIKELKEQLVILDPPSAKCSVRRWQQYGVVYVTLVNALIVYRYTKGIWTAQDIFEYYYKRSASATTASSNANKKD